MKNLKLKSTVLSFLVILAFSIVLTSCEQEEIANVPVDTKLEMTQEEIDEATAEYELIQSYGQEVVDAYNAYMEGETLGYYSPLGVTDPVDFDWSNYAKIMEHTSVMRVVEKSGMSNLFMEKFPVGTYLTRQHVEKIAPQLMTAIDDPEMELMTTRDPCAPYTNSGWQACSGCHYAGMCVGCDGGGVVTFYFQRDWCRYWDNACACNVYVERRTGGC